LKRLIFILLCLTSSNFVFAQKQVNTWYFGNGIGLDFNQTPPLPLFNGTVNSFEGSSTMSDNNGRLLFYTNGLTVQNRKHVNMLSGTGLQGELSSTNNTVIVPMPGADSVYYLFTIGSASLDPSMLHYNIIDLKRDGGYGEVILKNAVLESQVLEKIAAIRHCNKKDVWIVIQKFDTENYYSYLLTASGLNTVPVVSPAGLVITGQPNNGIGTLKFSAKGDKLVACHAFDNDVVQIMDFDNQTGIISNSIQLKPNVIPHDISFPGVYGAEFSPDGRLLYVSTRNSAAEPCYLYQFDITSHDPVAIQATRQIISQVDPLYALQTGPDQKIYIARGDESGALASIENPDVYGPGCNFVLNKINFGRSNTVQFGLPTFIQSYFDINSNPYDFSRLGNCTDLSVPFRISRLNSIDSVKWDFGDGQNSTILQPTNTYAAPGFYDVTLIVYKVDCSGLYDTIRRKIWIAAADKFLGNDTSSCNAIAMEIGIDEIPGVNYLWNTGSNLSKITTGGFGDYWLRLEQNGCRLADTIKVSQKPKPLVNLGADTTICLYRPVILSTGAATYDSYLWSTGETTPSILVNQTGTYYITVTKDECAGSDTVRVTPGDCDVYIPSAFTPNNDNLNEKFGVVENAFVQDFSFRVFSKWGELIFHSTNINDKWDGTFKGKKMPSGSYFWMLNYTNSRGRKMYEQGMVMLIR
jgi:gliding motility-associated-like protein